MCSSDLDALEGQTFTGVVDNVSINGTTAGGATSYPVTILIKDYGDLKPGMNVSATIEGDRVPNALCIPVDAVNRGNTVTVPGPGAMNADNTAVADVSKLETREVTLGKRHLPRRHPYLFSAWLPSFQILRSLVFCSAGCWNF